MSKPDYKKIQATRRKTLFPLSSKQINRHRMVIACSLSMSLNIYEIRQVMRISPDSIRNLITKGGRRGLVASLKNLMPMDKQ